MNDYLTILPNRLFYTKEDSVSLYRQCNSYKLILILDYLYSSIDKIGFSKLSIEDIVITYGYKVNRNKGKINEQVKNILIELQLNEIIKCDKDISKINYNDFIKCVYGGIEINDNGDYTKFTMISSNIIDYILRFNKIKIDNVALLFYYCYLCSRIYKSSNEHGKSYIHNGKAEECHPSYKTITKDIDIKPDTIKKYNDILVNMNLIRIGNCGLCYNKGDENNVRESPNFYVLTEDKDKIVESENSIWDWNLKEGMKAYKKKNPNMVFLDTREYKNNNKKINGYISRITQLEKQDKATKKQIKKRDKLLSEKEDNKQNIKEEC